MRENLNCLFLTKDWKICCAETVVLSLIWLYDVGIELNFKLLLDMDYLHMYSQISLKTTICSQQIFQCLVRNKQFKFSRVFEIKTKLDELGQVGN